jgi:hypothetical protein
MLTTGSAADDPHSIPGPLTMNGTFVSTSKGKDLPLTRPNWSRFYKLSNFSKFEIDL